jgi:adenylate cyclase
VIARTSASAFTSKSVTGPEIARALNVATVLEGSVRKAGNRIRVSVQLVQASDSSHLWSETYDRTLEDVFAVQDDIAHAVVKELRSKLLGEAYDTLASGQARAEVARAARGRTKNPEAQRLYLQAQHLFVRVATHEDLLVPMAYLKKALALDPGFALAWTELSRAYRLEAKRGWVPLNEGYARARMATEQALSLEPDLAEGYAELGRIQTYPDWNLQAAKKSYARALELEPGNPVALRGASTVELYLGHFEKVVELNRRALEDDPLSAGTYHNIGGALVHLHRFAEAEEALRKALEIDPLKLASRSQLAKCLVKQGRGEEALIVAAEERSEFHRMLAQLKVHEEMGHREEADRLLREMMDKQGNRAAFQYAELYSLRGEVDLAFKWLDVAYAERDGGLLGLNNSEELRPLHKDPRWTPLLKKMGLEKG